MKPELWLRVSLGVGLVWLLLQVVWQRSPAPPRPSPAPEKMALVVQGRVNRPARATFHLLDIPLDLDRDLPAGDYSVRLDFDSPRVPRRLAATLRSPGFGEVRLGPVQLSGSAARLPEAVLEPAPPARPRTALPALRPVRTPEPRPEGTPPSLEGRP